MLASTPGLVLHATPYSESSVVVKVFTRLFGVRSFIIKGVRGHGSRVKQNMLQPLSSLDMVVYINSRGSLNHVKEISPRNPGAMPDAVGNALRFFKTEVLYKALHEDEPMPELFDYVEKADGNRSDEPILFLLTVTRHLGIEPLDNHSIREPLFDLQEGRYVSSSSETTLTPALSSMLHDYLESLSSRQQPPAAPLSVRRNLIDALIAYYQLHLSGFRNFNSHEILHTVLR